MRTAPLHLVASLLFVAAPMPVLAESEEVTKAEEPLRIVYHLGDGIDQAARAMANIRSQMKIMPDIRIVVVAIGPGVDFLVDGAKDRHGNPFDATVQDLAEQGVQFIACGNTLTSRGIEPETLLPEATVVTSGMNEIARLELRDGHAYIRP